MSNELIGFIKARLDEDEQAALTAQDDFGAVWTVDEAMGSVRSDTGADVLDEPATPRAHIARHDPARVLREIDAKRRILARHTNCGTGIGYCDDGGHAWDDEDGPRGCADLADLARPYSDHPQFREEWRL